MAGDIYHRKVFFFRNTRRHNPKNCIYNWFGDTLFQVSCTHHRKWDRFCLHAICCRTYRIGTRVSVAYRCSLNTQFGKGDSGMPEAITWWSFSTSKTRVQSRSLQATFIVDKVTLISVCFLVFSFFHPTNCEWNKEHVHWRSTDISEEDIASIFSVE
jgi:hypothetical protein